jgi:hypothetical protein
LVGVFQIIQVLNEQYDEFLEKHIQGKAEDEEYIEENYVFEKHVFNTKSISDRL